MVFSLVIITNGYNLSDELNKLKNFKEVQNFYGRYSNICIAIYVLTMNSIRVHCIEDLII